MNKANAYDQMFSQNHQQAVSDITNQYNSPLNTLTALRSNTQVAQPGIGPLAPTAQSGIQPPNYQGLVEQNYQGQLAAYEAQQQAQSQELGGLFGLGGSLIGGLGKLSDREDKADVKKLGTDKNSGLPVFAYRYKGDPKSNPKVVGPMAADVERKYPGSTTKIGGHQVLKAKWGLGG